MYGSIFFPGSMEGEARPLVENGVTCRRPANHPPLAMKFRSLCRLSVFSLSTLLPPPSHDGFVCSLRVDIQGDQARWDGLQPPQDMVPTGSFARLRGVF